MNTNYYKNFITLVETGNITMAADKLKMAQSALSKQINTLQKHYGVELIEKTRGRRQFVLTPAGLDFLRRAQEIVAAEEGIVLDMQVYKKSLAGTLRISLSQATVSGFMEKFIVPFAQEHPEINFQMHEEIVADQIKSMNNNLIDIAYANAPLPETQNFKYCPLATEHFYAVYKLDNTMDFFPGETVRLKDLEQLPLSVNYSCLNLINTLFSASHFDPDIRFVVTTGTAACKFAEEGGSVAVVAAAACKNLPKGMAKVLIDEKDMYYEQTLYWSSDPRNYPVLRKFIEFVLEKSGKSDLIKELI